MGVRVVLFLIIVWVAAPAAAIAGGNSDGPRRYTAVIDGTGRITAFTFSDHTSPDFYCEFKMKDEQTVESVYCYYTGVPTD